eukprot:5898429-Alexandrium_andersonii.AAC.2
MPTVSGHEGSKIGSLRAGWWGPSTFTPPGPWGRKPPGPRRQESSDRRERASGALRLVALSASPAVVAGGKAATTRPARQWRKR